MKKFFFLFSFAFFGALPLLAELTLATPFSDKAILQQKTEIPVWGKANPGAVITVTFAEKNAVTKTKEDGSWFLKLPALTASKEGKDMVIKEEGGDTVVLHDILIGEVWFASGQSNMECPIWSNQVRYRDAYGKMMIQMTNNKNIRFVKEKKAWSIEPKLYRPVTWRCFTPADFKACFFERGHFCISAVAFYFALQLYASLDIPIGIIDASWGGTNIDAWTPPSGYEGKTGLDNEKNYKVTDKKEDFIRQEFISSQIQQPGVLWNAMVAAWTPYAIKGFIWYQGCHNNREASRYCEKMHALYDGWKKEFQNDNLKLYFAELAPFRENFFQLRKAQAKFVKEEPNAALAVTCDIGNMSDVHPNKKEPVARRLALHALKRDYGFSHIVDDAPELLNYEVKEGQYFLSFSNVTNWYYYNDDYSRPTGFEVCDEIGRYYPAQIKNEVEHSIIKGTEIIVANDDIKNPKGLRYLASPPYAGSLYSRESGLPVGPFEIPPPRFRRGPEFKLGDALKLKELTGFKLVLQSDLPSGVFNDSCYSIDERKEVPTFSKIAYLLELQNEEGQIDWAVAILDAFTQDVNKIGVPLGNTCFNQAISNLTLRSNIPSLEEVTNSQGGYIEFWTTNYSERKANPEQKGSDQIFDCNDTPSQDGHYGCLQIHNAATEDTIIAFNNFNTLYTQPDIGVGTNYDGPNKDYTFMANAGKYLVRRLSILVK